MPVTLLRLLWVVKEKGCSQERLAEAAYLDRSYLAGIKSGLRNPSVRSLLKIANALKVQVRDLFGEG